MGCYSAPPRPNLDTKLDTKLGLGRAEFVLVNKISHTHSLLPFWPCSLVGRATVIKSEGRGFKSHTGQSFSLSSCGPNSNTRVDL